MSKFEMSNIFASKVFNDKVMREKLPKNVYLSLKNTIKQGIELDTNISDVVASAMKDWAIEQGATHYCHWFIPMTGSPAEKHNAFLNLIDNDQVIMEFSGKNLIKGESDASSFPSGGLRATFEARGYTAWDCTSPAFIKETTLCIPTIFCSYNGEALDKKTPLLRSMECLNTSVINLMKLIGDTTTRVFPSVGAEQEYFLIDEAIYNKRPDLKIAGRTLLGAMAPKGQQLDDHYYGNINKRVNDFMCELDNELWEIGITSKTKHNEVAPCQHELAPIHEIASIACDHNHLTMETMKVVAKRHRLVCLLNEKPFEGVNGSGKHINWSIITNKGENLFKPGHLPEENKRFLLMVVAMMRAVDLHSDLLRLSISSAHNDNRLGSHEAPPTIISMFLGENLCEILKIIKDNGTKNKSTKIFLDTGIATLPKLMLDTTDRNRTTPLAFTGDKFEFRMPGSSISISEAVTTLNTAFAESIDYICDYLEKEKDTQDAIYNVIREITTNHDRILFNGDGYSKDWQTHALSLGLPYSKNTVEAARCMLNEKNVKLFSDYKVYSHNEVNSRYEIILSTYNKVRDIEAKTLFQMIKNNIIPSTTEYINATAYGINQSTVLGLDVDYQKRSLIEINIVAGNLVSSTNLFENHLMSIPTIAIQGTTALSNYYLEVILADMLSLRKQVDTLEKLLPANVYPFPTYTDIFLSVS